MQDVLLELVETSLKMSFDYAHIVPTFFREDEKICLWLRQRRFLSRVLILKQFKHKTQRGESVQIAL